MPTPIAYFDNVKKIRVPVTPDSPLPVNATVDVGDIVIEDVTVAGTVAHDAAGAAVFPILVGGYASAAAPTGVSADGDAVDSWFLRNGAQAMVITAGGALIGGDATNGMDVDVTRMSALVAGSAIIGNVRIDQTTPGTTNAVAGSGTTAHDASASGVAPVLTGGYASAAAPSAVSADGDAVNAWRLRNGAAATVLTAAGALIGGDASNGLDVDVTRMAALVAGTAAIGSTKDDGPSWTTVWGVSAAPFASADASSIVSVTDAPTGGQKLVIDDLIFSCGAAISLTFKCETSAAIIAGPFYMAVNSSMQVTPRGKGWKLATADKKLQVIASGAGTVMVLASYHSES